MDEEHGKHLISQVQNILEVLKEDTVVDGLDILAAALSTTLELAAQKDLFDKTNTHAFLMDIEKRLTGNVASGIVRQTPGLRRANDSRLS